MQHFSNLKVWQRSHAMVLNLYKLTASFPSDERFGLISQLRRAGVSVRRISRKERSARAGRNTPVS